MGEYYAGIPRSVKVGPYTFVIKLEDACHDDALGTFSFDRAEIGLRIGQGSAVCALDTVLHEVMHAVYRVFALPTKAAEEEQIVGAMSTGMIQVFMDNPGLVSWINKTLRK